MNIEIIESFHIHTDSEGTAQLRVHGTVSDEDGDTVDFALDAFVDRCGHYDYVLPTCLEELEDSDRATETLHNYLDQL